MKHSSRHIGTALLLSTIALSVLAPHVKVEASTFTEWAIPPFGMVYAMPYMIAASDGFLYFTDYSRNGIGRLEPSTGAFAEWIIPQGSSSPMGIAVSGSLVYFAENQGQQIGCLDPSTGLFAAWIIPTAMANPIDIVVYGDNVYFTESGADRIGLLNPSTGLLTEWVTPTGGSRPAGIVVNASMVYFVEGDTGKIGRLDPATSVFTEWTLTREGSHPKGIAVSGSYVYFTDYDGDRIGRLNPATGVLVEWTIPTSGSQPHSIIEYSGLIYFTESSPSASKIGCLDPSTGIFTEWTTPTASSMPSGIVAYGGSIYFTEQASGGRIGRLTVNPASTITTPVSKTVSTNTNTSAISTASNTYFRTTSRSSSTRSTTSTAGTATSSVTVLLDTVTIETAVTTTTTTTPTTTTSTQTTTSQATTTTTITTTATTTTTTTSFLGGKGSTRLVLSALPTPGYINQQVTISGTMYGSWGPIKDGMVVGKPVNITTAWGFKTIVTTGGNGQFSTTTICPGTGGTYKINATFVEDSELTGNKTSINYQILAYIETTLTLSHRYESGGMGGARRFYGYLKEKNTGNPVAGKTIRLTIYSGGYGYIFDVTTNSQGYYDYLFTTNGGIFTWAEARFAGSGLYLASFSGRIYA